MGIDKKARLKGHVPVAEIENYIYNNWDKGVRSKITKVDKDKLSDMFGGSVLPKSFNTLGEGYHCRYGNIIFTKDGVDYMMFYSYTNIVSPDITNPENQAEYELNEMEKTGLSLWTDPDGNSVKIMRELAGAFGGYVLDKDTGDSNWYPVDKTGNPAEMQPIIHITRKELNEKYGGIVVVDDY